MRANIEDYYRLFNDRDAERVDVFDRIIDSPNLGEELKAKLLEWHSTAKAQYGEGIHTGVRRQRRKSPRHVSGRTVHND